MRTLFNRFDYNRAQRCRRVELFFAPGANDANVVLRRRELQQPGTASKRSQVRLQVVLIGAEGGHRGGKR
jgi:hypothetical protein